MDPLPGDRGTRMSEKPTDIEESRKDTGPATSQHVSFVQRLKKRFGKAVDPEISLQDEDEDPSESPSRGLYLKLSEKGSTSVRYTVRGELARGGMGAILRVWDDDLRRNLAMKVLLGRGGKEEATDSTGIDEELLGRFLEEAQITGQLDHPGIVPVHDLGIDDSGRVYFTMRLVRGRDLKQILDLMAEGKEGWTQTKALHVMLKVCEAMAFSHSKGVVHRDLKPANIMVGRFGEAYVMDWGLARVLGRRDSHDLRIRTVEGTQLSLVRTARQDDQEADPQSPLVTMDGDVIGTPSYMAIEQAEGRLEDVGPRSDVYSLGAILYQMLAGQAPYVKPSAKMSPQNVLTMALAGPPTPIAKLNKEVPGELIAICEKAMARDPADRYVGMLDMADDIEAFLEGRVVRAYEAGSVAEFRKWVGRNQGMAAAIGVAILLALGGLASIAAVQANKTAQLASTNVQLQEAKNKAVENETTAIEAKRVAEQEEERARRAESRATTNARLAQENEELSRRRSYAANLSAADYSLRLNEIGEAKAFHELCDQDLRGWEWDHLKLKLEGSQGASSVETASSEIRDIALAPDGRTIYALSMMGVLLVYDIAPGSVAPVFRFSHPLLRLLPGLSWEMDLSISPDGSKLVFVQERARVEIVSVDDLDASELLEIPDGRVACVEFGPDSRFVAVGYEDGRVVVYDLVAGETVHTLEGHTDAVTSLAWRSDGTWLASGSKDRSLRIWDPITGTGIRKLEGHEGAVLCVAFHPDGERVATGSRDQRVRIWHVEQGLSDLPIDFHTAPVNALTFDSRGEFLVTAADDMSVRVRDLRTGQDSVFLGHTDGVTSVAFSSHNDLIVSGSRDNTLRTWDPETLGAFTRLQDARLPRYVTAGDFSPDGESCLTATNQGDLAFWDAWSGELLRVIRGDGTALNSAVWSDDGRWILTGSADKTAVLWDAATGKKHRTLAGHTKWVTSVALDRAATRAVTGSGDKTARVWDVQTGETLLELEGHKRWVKAVAITSDGSRVVTGSSDKSIRVWDAETGAILRVLDDAEVGIRSLALSGDDTLLAAGCEDGTVWMWDLTTGELKFTASSGQEDPITCLAFNHDGSRLASGSSDGVVRVWDAQLGAFLLALRGHTGWVQVVAFNKEGTRLLSGSNESQVDAGPKAQTARIWETGDLSNRRVKRRAALTLREKVLPIVEQLFLEKGYVSTVVDAIVTSREMNEDMRQAALILTQLRYNDPGWLMGRSWKTVRRGGASRAEYDLARKQAEAAAAMAPDDQLCTAVLGMAQYRARRYAAARETLRNLEQPPADPKYGTVYRAFLAMSHKRLGDEVEASARMDDLRGYLAANRDAIRIGDAAVVEAIVREAEELIGVEILETEGPGGKSP
ncbi:MAG: protein kinase [Planctomycetota bacterium]|nr:protein kinase [Planctomycetota bacterium]